MKMERKTTTAARNFIERFGDDAPAEALKRAEELRRAGNIDSADTWMEIYKEVKMLVAHRGAPH